MIIISQTRRIINFPQISRLSCQSADCNFDLTCSIRQINQYNNSNKTINKFSVVPLPFFNPLFTPDKPGFLLKLRRPATAALARTPLMPVRTRIDSQSLNWTTRYRGICRHGTVTAAGLCEMALLCQAVTAELCFCVIFPVADDRVTGFRTQIKRLKPVLCSY